MKAVFFDFDGVIHNTFQVHRKGIHLTSGYDISEQEYRDMHNGNFHDAHVAGLDHMDWGEYGRCMKHVFRKLSLDRAVRQTLERLAKKYSLYIVSSSREHVIRAYLEANHISRLFSGVLAGELNRRKMEKFEYLFETCHITPGETVFVTDTLGDILEANEVGLRTIAVDFGYHSAETLRRGRPYAIISHFSEIEWIVSRMKVEKTSHIGLRMLVLEIGRKIMCCWKRIIRFGKRNLSH